MSSENEPKTTSGAVNSSPPFSAPERVFPGQWCLVCETEGPSVSGATACQSTNSCGLNSSCMLGLAPLYCGVD